MTTERFIAPIPTYLPRKTIENLAEKTAKNDDEEEDKNQGSKPAPDKQEATSRKVEEKINQL